MEPTAPNVVAQHSHQFLDSFKQLISAYPAAGLREVFRLLPDGLFLGVGLFALLTQNYPLAVLFGTLAETLFITLGLQRLFGFLDMAATAPTEGSQTRVCTSGFQSPTLETLSLFFKLPFKSALPSPPVFVLTTAISYVLVAMQGFQKEMSELGPGFSTRYMVGIFLSLLLLFIVTLFRFLSGCEGVGILILSILFGFFMGLLLAWQNTTMFGRDSTNLLGIPMFTNRTADGKPIYICPQTK